MEGPQKAAFTRYLRRQRTGENDTSIGTESTCATFSLEPQIMVRFRGPEMAKRVRSQSEQNAKADFTCAPQQ